MRLFKSEMNLNFIGQGHWGKISQVWCLLWVFKIKQVGNYCVGRCLVSQKVSQNSNTTYLTVPISLQVFPPFLAAEWPVLQRHGLRESGAHAQVSVNEVKQTQVKRHIRWKVKEKNLDKNQT